MRFFSSRWIRFVIAAVTGPLIGAILMAQSGTTATIAVKELPPEAIPAGSCSESQSGFLGVVGQNGKERTALTAIEIGEYIRNRLSQGYSITLHPQLSGRIYVIAECHKSSATVAPAR